MKIAHIGWTGFLGQSANMNVIYGFSWMHLSRSALFFMLLSWLMALLFSMDILAWLARISLLCLELRNRKQLFSSDAGSSGLPYWRNTNLPPLLDEFELHGLLLLHGGQELLEVFALLRDVAVLHLLLLVAVAAEQLWPLFRVLCSDVLYLGVKTTARTLKCTQTRLTDVGTVCAKVLGG